MEVELKTWFYDILTAIQEIQTFLIDTPDFTDYKNDQKTKRAIERNLEIIGEAMTRILKAHPSIQLSNSRKIIDTRNRIIHGYDTVSDEVIWSIVTSHLPLLKIEIESLLK